MWIHIVIFGILLVVFIGSKAGWFSSKKEEKDRSLSLFLAVALAGNLLGMALTVQNGDSQVYVEGAGLKKEEDQTYAFLFLITGTVLFLIKRREGQAVLVKRQEELLMDYPGLIMKFTLLVQAGMTVRKIFQKMAFDYQRKQGKRKRTAYEEILILCHEMDSGVSEMEAYRRFGERCGQVKYKTFATMLIQNLQKGSRQLADMLEKESMEAWDERKRKARVLGEAAATKLLVPMILMLLVVMAVIMIPACLAFYGN